MEYIRLTGISKELSRIGLGSQPIGYHTRASGRATVAGALEQGITLIDTAPAYGRGRAERLLGEVLHDYDREDFVLASKTGLEPRNGGLVRNSNPEWIRKDLAGSLERLQTDYIDIYQIHWPDPLVPQEETARVMDELKEEGTIKAIGLSNYSVAQIREFEQAAAIDTLQNPYNIFERGIEHSVLPYSQSNELVLLAYRSLCQGILTGQLQEDTDFSGHVVKRDDPKYRQPRYHHYLEAVKLLDGLARERHDRGVLDLAIQWILDNPKTIALWGAWKPEYLRPVNAVLGWKLDSETRQEIDRIVAETIKDPVGPEFLAPSIRE
ncbi:MAG: aldo/keto reductase [Candidatus Methanospirareceae archaeon]